MHRLYIEGCCKDPLRASDGVGTVSEGIPRARAAARLLPARAGGAAACTGCNDVGSAPAAGSARACCWSAACGFMHARLGSGYDLTPLNLVRDAQDTTWALLRARIRWDTDTNMSLY